MQFNLTLLATFHGFKEYIFFVKISKKGREIKVPKHLPTIFLVFTDALSKFCIFLNY